jgi:hypothetical protein
MAGAVETIGELLLVAVQYGLAADKRKGLPRPEFGARFRRVGARPA